LPDGTPAPGDKAPFAYLGKMLRPSGAELRMHVADWSKFIRVHLGECVNSAQLVCPATLARLHQGINVDDPASGIGYAMGWIVAPAAAGGLDPKFGTIITHNGSDGVWLAEVTAFPDQDFAIAIMSNATVDRTGEDLGSAAFTEIKARLLSRFGPNIEST